MVVRSKPFDKSIAHVTFQVETYEPVPEVGLLQDYAGHSQMGYLVYKVICLTTWM